MWAVERDRLPRVSPRWWVAARRAGHLLARIASLVVAFFAVVVITFVRLLHYDNQCFVW